MRVGVLTRGEVAEVQWAHRLGFQSIEWIRFDESACNSGAISPLTPALSPLKGEGDWKPFAERFAAEAKSLDIRISAIGALYRNPLDPKQSKFARATFHRAI